MNYGSTWLVESQTIWHHWCIGSWKTLSSTTSVHQLFKYAENREIKLQRWWGWQPGWQQQQRQQRHNENGSNKCNNNNENNIADESNSTDEDDGNEQLQKCTCLKLESSTKSSEFATTWRVATKPDFSPPSTDSLLTTLTITRRHIYRRRRTVYGHPPTQKQKRTHKTIDTNNDGQSHSNSYSLTLAISPGLRIPPHSLT